MNRLDKYPSIHDKWTITIKYDYCSTNNYDKYKVFKLNVLNKIIHLNQWIQNVNTRTCKCIIYNTSPYRDTGFGQSLQFTRRMG